MGTAPFFPAGARAQGQRPARVTGRGPRSLAGAALLPPGNEGWREGSCLALRGRSPAWPSAPTAHPAPGAPPTLSPTSAAPRLVLPLTFWESMARGYVYWARNRVEEPCGEAEGSRASQHCYPRPPPLLRRRLSLRQNRPRPVRAQPARAPSSRRGCQGERAARRREGGRETGAPRACALPRDGMEWKVSDAGWEGRKLVVLRV